MNGEHELVTDENEERLVQVPFDFLDSTLKATEITKQISWVATHRSSQFIPNLFSLRSHKSVAVRRKAAETLTLFAPKDNDSEIEAWQADESDRNTWLLLENLKDEIVRRASGGLESDKRVFTVSEALYFVRKTIGAREYVIEGEIDEVRIFGTDHAFYYLVLKDEEGETMRANCPEFVVARLGFALNEGLTVRIRGAFKIGKNGMLSLAIAHIELTGEGALAKNLAELEKKLIAEGLFDVSRKRVPPPLPHRVLLIASPNSAAIDDFMTVLSARRGGITVYLLPIKTQGVGAERLLLEQLARVNDIISEKQIEAVVITRGGGAKDDLVLFNAESVVRALYRISVPLIAAIGHERDTTLVEMVADLRSSTPSQAAEKVSRSRAEVMLEVRAEFESLLITLQQRFEQYDRVAEQLVDNISMIIRSYVDFARQIVADTDRTIIQLLERTKYDIKNTFESAIFATRILIERQLRLVQVLTISAQPCTALVDKYRNEVDFRMIEIHGYLKNTHTETVCESDLRFEKICGYDIASNLQKGFALIMSESKDVTTLTALKEANYLDIHLSGGVSTVQIRK